MGDTVHDIYGNRLRLRACGILIEGKSLLMVNHRLGSGQDFWAPPGGGVEFGESAVTCLRREMLEETGLETEVGEFLFACEYINNPLHAVELFFRVQRLGGNLITGTDPEQRQDQIIQTVRFLDWDEVQGLPPASLHGVFRFAGRPDQIEGLRGYFKL